MFFNLVMNVCDFIIDTLYNNGIDTYFVVTGGSIVPFIDAVYRNHDVRYFCFQHEQSAAMAAEGYFKSSGKVAAVCVTSGPGVQNILNGVCGCWYDSVPTFFITGQVNTSEDLSNLKSKPRQLGFQEMPVAKMFEDVTKKSVHVSTKDDISNTLRHLLTELKTPRYGPVLLDIPVNIQMSTIEATCVHIPPRLEPIRTYDLTEYLKHSKRPLVIFGHGVKLSQSCEAALNFVETYNLPFVVSWGAVDISQTNHKLRVGCIGVYGERYANYTVQNTDLLIIIGNRLDSRQIGGNPKLFSPFSKKIMVDIDRNEIDKLDERGVVIDMKIVDDVSHFFRSVKIDIESKWEQWLNTINQWKDKYRVEAKRLEDPVVYDFLNNYFSKLPEDCIVITDIGSNMVWSMQCAQLTKNTKIVYKLWKCINGFRITRSYRCSYRDE
jgi:acetolactate synthase-1/2/3 large subunit